MHWPWLTDPHVVNFSPFPTSIWYMNAVACERKNFHILDAALILRSWRKLMCPESVWPWRGDAPRHLLGRQLLFKMQCSQKLVDWTHNQPSEPDTKQDDRDSSFLSSRLNKLALAMQLRVSSCGEELQPSCNFTSLWNKRLQVEDEEQVPLLTVVWLTQAQRKPLLQTSLNLEKGILCSHAANLISLPCRYCTVP